MLQYRLKIRIANALMCVHAFMYEYIRESVDSLSRDGADAQYMQYLSNSYITCIKTTMLSQKWFEYSLF